MQKDFETIKHSVERGDRLRTKLGDFFGTFSSNSGGFDKENPPSSDPKSLVGTHPTRDYEQRRACQIKPAGVLEILEESLTVDRVSQNRATGIDRDTLWEFAEQKSTDNLDEFRTDRPLEEFTEDK